MNFYILSTSSMFFRMFLCVTKWINEAKLMKHVESLYVTKSLGQGCWDQFAVLENETSYSCRKSEMRARRSVEFWTYILLKVSRVCVCVSVFFMKEISAKMLIWLKKKIMHKKNALITHNHTHNGSFTIRLMKDSKLEVQWMF